jgi:hypothetical protein
MEVFSTITSPVFSELVIILGTNAITELPPEVKLFETLRTMSRARPFKLVFLLVAQDLFQGEAQRRLAGTLDSVAARGLLDFLASPTTIRIARIRDQGWGETVD